MLPAAGCCGKPAAAYQACVFADFRNVEGQRTAIPQPGGKQAPVRLLVAAVAHEPVGAAPDLPEVEVRGDVEEGAQIAAAGLRLPGIQLGATGDGGDLLELRAEGHPFEESAKFAQAAVQAEDLRALQRTRRTAGLDRQRMRPFAG